MYTRKQIVKETIATALWDYYLNPFAFLLCSALWVSVLAPVFFIRTPLAISVALVINGSIWAMSYRAAREALMEPLQTTELQRT